MTTTCPDCSPSELLRPDGIKVRSMPSAYLRPFPMDAETISDRPSCYLEGRGSKARVSANGSWTTLLEAGIRLDGRCLDESNDKADAASLAR